MTTSEAAELARQRLGWSPDESPRLETFVPKALQRLYETYGKHKTKRRYTWSDPTSTAVTLDSDGKADLATLSDNGLLLDQLDYGEISHADSAFPLVRQSGSAEGSLFGNYDNIFMHYFLVGTVIHVRGLNGAVPTGDLHFACTQVQAINDLLVQLEDEFVDILVLVAQGQPKADISVAAQ